MYKMDAYLLSFAVYLFAFDEYISGNHYIFCIYYLFHPFDIYEQEKIYINHYILY